MRHLLVMEDVAHDLESILRDAETIKSEFGSGDGKPLLSGKTVALLFEKSSTRTRVSLEAGTHRLGGHPIVLNAGDLQMGRGESIEDTARVLSRYVDLIAYRCFRHEDLEELARHAAIPVVNALSDREHPLQVIADWLTIREEKGKLKGLRFAYAGDGNNMARSYLIGAAISGMHARIATPKGYEPGEEYVARARTIARTTGATIETQIGFEGALDDADVVATDTWVSMGDEKEKEQRLHDFRGFTIDERAMRRARRDAIFLHCLPAYYGKEVTKEVAHGPRSRIFEEAENRMWTQMAVMVALIGAGTRRAERVRGKGV